MADAAAEIEAYNLQLAQVETALQNDPDNAELGTLKAELENLIALTRSLLPSGSTPPPAAKPAAPRAKRPAFSTGQEVLARYPADSRFYPARIVAVAGQADNPMYTVVYKGYGNTEILPLSALKHFANHHDPPPPPPVPAASTSTPPPPPPTTAPPDPDAERKKARTEKKLARREVKQAEAVAKTASWQNFARKATAKGSLKQPDKSIFKTSANPYAKVGVGGPTPAAAPAAPQYRKHQQ